MVVFLSAQSKAPANISGTTSFAWGFGGSAYQMEGAWNKDGKGPSAFDVWSHSSSVRAGQPNADVSADHYNRVKSDLSYLGQLGATAYRFSVAWTRILPNCTGQVNQAGVQFYSDMIDEILRQGAEPFLTMYHWDMPQACLDQFQGFLGDQIVDAFTAYADVLFKNYGDRVKYWLTLNEPQAHCKFCYASSQFGPALNLGDDARFKCMHNSHLIHGSVVKLASTNYASQRPNWHFGLPSILEWHVPDGSGGAADAGWFYGPCINGEYPPETIQAYGNKLAAFTPAQSAMLKGSCDYIALNYYGCAGCTPTMASGKSWQSVHPAGARLLANWMYKRYPIEIIFTEIGYTAPGEKDWTAQQIISDYTGLRGQFWNETISNVTALVTVDKIPVKGMIAWALLDNFEFVQYDDRFGCIAVDFTNGTLTRLVKGSTIYMSNYFKQFSNPFQRAALAPSATVSNGSSNASIPTGNSSGVSSRTTTSGGEILAIGNMWTFIVGILIAGLGFIVI